MLCVPNVPTLNTTFWLLTFFFGVSKQYNDIDNMKKKPQNQNKTKKKTKTNKNQQEKIMTPPLPQKK